MKQAGEGTDRAYAALLDLLRYEGALDCPESPPPEARQEAGGATGADDAEAVGRRGGGETAGTDLGAAVHAGLSAAQPGIDAAAVWVAGTGPAAGRPG